MIILLQFLLFLIFLYIFCNFSKKSKYRWPPGPVQLPVIGSVISVLLADVRKPWTAFAKLSRKYGSIFTVKIGSVRMVVVSSHALLSKIEFSDKLLSHVDTNDVWLLEKSDQIPLGLLFSIPEFWNTTRSMVQKTLHQFGFHTKSKIEVAIVEEIAEFCESLKQRMTNGQICLEMRSEFIEVFYNIVWTLLTGKKCTLEDAPVRKNQITAMLDFVSCGNASGKAAIIFPILIKMLPNLMGYTKLKDCCQRWREVIGKTVAQQRKTRNTDLEPTNFLDTFLSKIDATMPPNNVLDTIYTETNLVATLQDLIVGGTDTQSVSINFFVRYLLQNPEVQEELYAEVDQVLGKSRYVNVDDIPNLVYTQAVVTELLRIVSAVPIAPRKLLDDWEFDGFLIPKGTFITMSIWGANRDETVWKNAETFNPKRFLSPDNKLINTEKLFTFGFGKRRCIGETLAKTNLMLVVPTLVQRFSFHIDPAYGVPSDGDVHGFSRDTTPYNVIIKARQ